MKVTINGIDCYGIIYKEQNIAVTCEDEFNDDIYCDGFDTWTEAVDYLTTVYPDIVELEAI